MGEHTPPGTAVADGTQVSIRHADGYGTFLCDTLWDVESGREESAERERAKMIAARWNMHDELVEALDEGARCLDDVFAGRGGWAVEDVLSAMRDIVERAKESA